MNSTQFSIKVESVRWDSIAEAVSFTNLLIEDKPKNLKIFSEERRYVWQIIFKVFDRGFRGKYTEKLNLKLKSSTTLIG